MRINRILAIGALGLLVIILAYGMWLAQAPKAQQLQGQIEAREYNISSKVPGRVEQVMVRRGDQVSAGDLLLLLTAPSLMQS